MIDVLPELRPLLADDRLNELGPASPNMAVKSRSYSNSNRCSHRK